MTHQELHHLLTTSGDWPGMSLNEILSSKQSGWNGECYLGLIEGARVFEVYQEVSDGVYKTVEFRIG